MKVDLSVKVVDVAVGLIIRDHQVLIAWRDFGRHQGSRYEFPGGKAEQGEDLRSTLQRELQEELGIHVTQAQFIQKINHQYPEKIVCLHVFKVTEFTGTPHGAEGQPIKWVALNTLHQYHFPDANTPIVRMAQLSDFYIISPEIIVSDGQAIASNAWIQQMIAHAPMQHLVYIRQPSMAQATQIQIIEYLHHARPDLQLIAPITLQYAQLPVAGYHLKHRQLMDLDVLPRQAHPIKQLFIAACHDAASIAQANALAVDAITIAPVNPTSTHANATPLGLDVFATLTAQASCPVYALGGMRTEDLTRVRQAGGFGVGGINGFLG